MPIAGTADRQFLTMSAVSSEVIQLPSTPTGTAGHVSIENTLYCGASIAAIKGIRK